MARYPVDAYSRPSWVSWPLAQTRGHSPHDVLLSDALPLGQRQVRLARLVVPTMFLWSGRSLYCSLRLAVHRSSRLGPLRLLAAPLVRGACDQEGS